MGYCCSELCKAKPDTQQGSALLTGTAFLGLQTVCKLLQLTAASSYCSSADSIRMTAEGAAEAKMLQS